MDALAFSEELCAWLDPVELLDAVLRYDEEGDQALQPTILFYPSHSLQSAEEGSLNNLISEFLQNFRVPSNLIQVLKSLTNVMPAKSSWKWLSEIRFEGTMELVGKGDNRYPKDTVLLIHERDAVASIIMQPIQLLVNMVGWLVSENWRPLAEIMHTKGIRQSNIFLLHSSPGPLGVYIESRIAQYYGISGASIAGEDLNFGIQNRFRAVTVIGEPPFSQKTLEAAKEAARIQALSTMKYTGESGHVTR